MYRESNGQLPEANAVNAYLFNRVNSIIKCNSHTTNWVIFEGSYFLTCESSNQLMDFLNSELYNYPVVVSWFENGKNDIYDEMKDFFDKIATAVIKESNNDKFRLFPYVKGY